MSTSHLIFPKPPGTSRIAARRAELREGLWPGIGPYLWHRKSEAGFSTLPRTLPLILVLLDELKEKGWDVSRVYFDLWCRQYDDSLVDVTDEEGFAFSSGFTGQGRNVRSWRERIRILEELGFIKVKPNGSRSIGYILINHPHRVVRELRREGKVSDAWWGAYVKRASEIGTTLEGGLAPVPEFDLFGEP